MSRGKYSPNLPTGSFNFDYFCYNAKGETPPIFKKGDTYDEEVHFGDYDEDGFDMYGYSAYDAAGTFVGAGNGVDRNGITEMEYLAMSDDEWEGFL